MPTREPDLPTAIERVRRFNRTVTLRIGALNSSFLGRGLPLGHARVLYEAREAPVEVRELRRRLDLDSGYVSRMLRSLERKELVETAPGAQDARVRVVSLTDTGRAELAELERLSDREAASLLDHLDGEQRGRLVAAMAEVERLFQASAVEVAPHDPRSDLARGCFERFFAELGERFEGGFDPARSLPADEADLTPPRGWLFLATVPEGAVGCGALKLGADGLAEVKRMWIAPELRGAGLGRRILTAIEDRARAEGVRALRLETNAALTEAQGLYRASGYAEVEPFSDEAYAHFWFEKQLD